MERCSAILMPVSSLPSPYGIGSFGKAAYEYVDFLAEAGQGCWQVLPLGPTSYGDSPYQSPSSFAGNPYFIDLDLLIADGLLTMEEVEAYNWGSDPRNVDYAALYAGRFELLAKAKARGWDRDRADIAAFERENADWLPDYALFMALKRHFGMKSWIEWSDEDARLRRPEALARYRETLRADLELFTYLQFLFFRQWDSLKAYANEKRIRIIGDLPIYVALDSADVWAAPQFFQLDSRGFPTEVSGVPPDYFNADGQLWGNPLYDYDAMERDSFGWWIRRVGGVAKLYDVIRIDHFRGFESYWAVPYGDKTARRGRWVKGPGMKLVGVLTGWFRDTEFIAEDLGYTTPEVRKLLDDSGLPGMKVLEFAFGSGGDNDHLPHKHAFNATCYTATHDNEPLALWKTAKATRKELAFAKEYGGIRSGKSFNDDMIRLGMRSAAKLFVAQMQDWLELGEGCRTNVPGVLGGNWTWRMLPGEATPELAQRILRMTGVFGRLVPVADAPAEPARADETDKS